MTPDKLAAVVAAHSEHAHSETRDLNKQVAQLQSALWDMVVAFRFLTTEGGWTTMSEEMKNQMVAYRNGALAAMNCGPGPHPDYPITLD